MAINEIPIIRLPQDPNQELLNQGMSGMGRVVANIFPRIEAQKRAEEQRAAEQDFQQKVVAAPSREDAIKIFSEHPAINKDNISQNLNFLNNVHPMKEPNPPDKEEYFKPVDKNAGAYEYVGKLPISQRPEGAMTKAQIDFEERARDNARQERIRKESDVNQTLAINRAYNSAIADQLNVKKSVGINGTILFDFEGDEDKAKAYRKALTMQKEAMDKTGGDINKAADYALTTSGAYTKKPVAQPVQPVAAPSMFESLKTKLFGNEKTLAAAPAAPQQQSAAPAPKAGGFIEGQVYADKNGNKAKYVKGKWEPL